MRLAPHTVNILPGRTAPSQTLPPGGGLGKPGFPGPLRTGRALPDPPTGGSVGEPGPPMVTLGVTPAPGSEGVPSGSRLRGQFAHAPGNNSKTGDQNIVSSTSRPATFRKRYYRSIAVLWSDLRHLASLRGRGSISPALRERLMLTVTAINRCRYCAAFHGYVAQLSGLPPEEVRRLLDGDVATAPAADLPALLYARQWAEAGGKASPELQGQLATIYGEEQARAIERALRMIWIGNLLGNTWDALLFRCSRGRW